MLCVFVCVCISFRLIKFVSFCCYRFSWWIKIFNDRGRWPGDRPWTIAASHINYDFSVISYTAWLACTFTFFDIHAISKHDNGPYKYLTFARGRTEMIAVRLYIKTSTDYTDYMRLSCRARQSLSRAETSFDVLCFNDETDNRKCTRRGEFHLFCGG